MKWTAGFDREKAWYRGNSIRYLVVEVEAPQRERVAAGPPKNVGLVIDASGSMRGDPLAAAKEAAAGVIEGLDEKDRVTVVSFSFGSTVHVDGLPCDAAGKARALAEVGRIRENGNTNLSGGWLQGAECVARVMNRKPGMQNRVIVLSDGHANEGIVEPELLGHHAQQLRLRGLFSSSVGIGDGYETAQLAAIARHGGGEMHHAARPREIIEVVLAELNGMSATVCEAVRLDVRLPAAVEIECLNGFPVHFQHPLLTAELGGMYAGETRSAVFQVRFPATEAGARLPFQARLAAQLPGDAGVIESEPLRLEMEMVRGRENQAQRRDEPRTMTAARIWQASVLRRIAVMNRAGDLREAAQWFGQELQWFRTYVEGLPGGEPLLEELLRVERHVLQPWAEGQRKEMEMMSFKRSMSRGDRRADAPRYTGDLFQ
jgi:Ca-activated chloride channel family protein